MMSFDWRLIQIFADGQFHSGEELGELLGISRAAVWKQLQKIEKSLSLQFESMKGRGYRLVDGLELLDHDKIIEGLPAELPYSLYILQQVDSTNRFATEIVTKGSSHGCAVLAEQQLAGRGRRGRQWVSPFGRNIYCSITWEFESGIAALEGLSLAVGVGVVRALRVVGIGDAVLKWPNDVIHDRQKIAGILLEITGDISGKCQVIIGIGINVAMVGALHNIDQPWTDANTAAGKRISRNKLASCLIMQLVDLLREFERSGFANIRDEWSALDYAKAKPVVVHVGEQIIHGIAAGIDESGALAIDNELGRQYFHGGEISLRVQN